MTNIIPQHNVERINVYRVRQHLAELEKSDQFDPYTVLILNHAIQMLEVFEENLFND